MDLSNYSNVDKVRSSPLYPSLPLTETIPGGVQVHVFPDCGLAGPD